MFSIEQYLANGFSVSFDVCTTRILAFVLVTWFSKMFRFMMNCMGYFWLRWNNYLLLKIKLSAICNNKCIICYSCGTGRYGTIHVL